MWDILAEWTGRFDWTAIGAIGTVGALFAVVHQTSRGMTIAKEMHLARIDAVIAIFDEAKFAIRLGAGPDVTEDELLMLYTNLHLIGGISEAADMANAFPVHDLPTSDAVFAFMLGLGAIRRVVKGLDEIQPRGLVAAIEVRQQHVTLTRAIKFLELERHKIADRGRWQFRPKGRH